MDSQFRKNHFPLISIKRLAVLIVVWLLNFSILPLSAQVVKEKGLSIYARNCSVSEVFVKIGKLTNCSFFYEQSALTNVPNVSINIKNGTLQQILEQLSKQTNLFFSRTDNTISVSTASHIVSDEKKPQKDIARHLISGVVVDNSNNPVVGAGIFEKDSKNNGTFTDKNGRFSIEVKENTTIEVSSLGFLTKYVNTGRKSNLLIVLSEDTKTLEEVVVVGYGTQKKLNLTGSVSSVSGEVLQDRPISNLAQGLQGAIPNLNIIIKSGQPSAGASINIRGNTSLNGGEALVLIDGVEGDISMINPQDVESVSVLKDAASAAIYGARAAFGVMLVTTKQGRENQKIKVNYNSNLSWSTPARLPKMPSSSDWVRAWNDAYDCESPGDYYFTDRFIEAVDAHLADPEHNPAILVDTDGIQSPDYTPNNPGWAYVGNTDWIHAFYRNAAFMQQHNVSLSGGSDKTRYYFSAATKDQEGIFRYGNDTYKRYNLTFSFDTKLSKWLDVGFTAKYNHIKNNEPYQTGGAGSNHWYYEVYRMFPTLSIFLPNGEFAGKSLKKGNFNVIARMAEAGRHVSTFSDVWYTGRFNITPLKGLSLKGNYTLNKYFKKSKSHRKSLYQTMPDGVAALKSETPNYVINASGENTYQSLNLWAEYDNSIGQSNFKLMGGYNHEGKNYTGFSYTMTDLFDNNTPVSSLAANYKENSETDTGWRIQGLFFRFNYDYKSKYLLEINGRYDSSSKFPKHKRSVFVPSGSIGWRISEEGFFSPLRKVIDNLKFRASYGVLGNQSIGSNFSYISTLKGGAMNNYMMDKQALTYISIPSVPNDVTWERVINQNYGLDIAMWNNRLSGSFDYYFRDTKDMIRPKTLPSVLGASGGDENIADMRTYGWEAEIRWKDTIENFPGGPLGYSVSAGIADYQSVITKFDNPNGNLALYYEGYKLGDYWGYVTDGFIVDDNEAAKMNYIQNFIYHTWHPGDIRYRDLNGDGEINIGENTLANPGDRTIIGNQTPRYQYNLQAGLSWKGFDFWVFFDGVAKRDIWTSSDQFWGFPRGIYNGNIFQYHIDNTWSPEHTDAYYPRKSLNNRNIQRQSKYMLNAAFFRLKSMTFSYSLPKKWLSQIHLQELKLHVSGQNLWEKTYMPPFMTPDIVESLSEGGANSGKEYAFMRYYSFGINITF